MVRVMADTPTLLVFSGAGLSAEIGIPTYRDDGGPVCSVLDELDAEIGRLLGPPESPP